ncbi:MAG: ADOP family duplicated permease, partial [Bryobacteraceae bacterium]
MNALLSDVKHAIRALFKSPGFTVTAIAALALGIGAATAIFSIVNTVLLKPLPIPGSDRLVALTMTSHSEIDDGWIASPAKFEYWRTQSTAIHDVSAFLPGVMNYTGGEVVEQWRSMRASADTFRCFGIQILRGRTFSQEEDLPNGPLVALIGENLWRRRFAGDPRILGRTISLSGEPHTVIGIVGADAGLSDSGPPAEVYVPFKLDPNTSDQGDYFEVAARLQPGVTLEQAQARLQASAGAYRAKFPQALGPTDGFIVKPFREALAGGVRPLLLLLVGAVGLVLLMACANVANLLLARAAGRTREIAIRAAIGARRRRIIRQLLTESGLLSLAGGALGLWLGYSGIRALLAVSTADLPLVGQNGAHVVIDWRVLGFALVASLVTGIVFGLLPALQGSRADLNSILKAGSSRTGTGLRQNKVRAALVVSEVGVAVVLLAGSALLIRSFVALYAVDRGFETKNVVTMRTLLAGPKYSKSMRVAATIRAGLEHVRSLPGVAAASATCCVPLQDNYDLNFDIIGQPAPDGSSTGDVGWATVSPGYFDVFKIPVKRGRAFTGADDGKSPAVVVINERMARQYWKDSDPLKERILIGRALEKDFKDEPVRQIVGIVGDVRENGLDSSPRPMMYVPQAQLPDSANALFVGQASMAWVVRTQA